MPAEVVDVLDRQRVAGQRDRRGIVSLAFDGDTALELTILNT